MSASGVTRWHRSGEHSAAIDTNGTGAYGTPSGRRVLVRPAQRSPEHRPDHRHPQPRQPRDHREHGAAHRDRRERDRGGGVRGRGERRRRPAGHRAHDRARAPWTPSSSAMPCVARARWRVQAGPNTRVRLAANTFSAGDVQLAGDPSCADVTLNIAARILLSTTHGFGIAGLTPDPSNATAARAYVSGANPDTATTTVTGPQFSSCELPYCRATGGTVPGVASAVPADRRAGEEEEPGLEGDDARARRLRRGPSRSRSGPAGWASSGRSPRIERSHGAVRRFVSWPVTVL